eukprot:7135373-Alexandrium_andersonii.AAC.1
MAEEPLRPRRVAPGHSRVQSCHRSRRARPTSASRASAARWASCMLMSPAEKERGEGGGPAAWSATRASAR